VKAFKESKSMDAASSEKTITEASKGATAVPMRVAERAKEIEQLAEKLRPVTNPKMASDLTVATALAKAAVTGALANVEINLEGMNDPAFVSATRERVKTLRP
jgi:formiminotetrahydrofolate cyclodeaminase